MLVVWFWEVIIDYFCCCENVKICFVWSGIGQQGEMCQHSIWQRANIPDPLKRSNGNCYFLVNSLKCKCIAQNRQKRAFWPRKEETHPKPFFFKVKSFLFNISAYFFGSFGKISFIGWRINCAKSTTGDFSKPHSFGYWAENFVSVLKLKFSDNFLNYVVAPFIAN